MARPTYMETDISRISNNIALLRGHLAPGTRYLAVVKANAYGHGAGAVLGAALAQGAWGGAVAIPEEGAALREEGFDCPLLILGGANAECARMAVEYDLSQAAPDLDTLKMLSAAAMNQGKNAKAHLKLDTGMGRIGVRDAAELDDMLDFLTAHPEVQLEGVFAHFAMADEPGADAENYTRTQAARFGKLADVIKRRGFKPIFHMGNSAGMIRYPEYDLDMVRMGVSMYGFSPYVKGLKYAQRWITRALFIKDVPENTALSYGGTFVTKRPSRIMTLPVGYADGYLRAFGNRADVLISGMRAPVVGRVCMDQIMIDVTDVPGACLDDEVVLMGWQGNEDITPEELAEIAATIPYEIMLGTHSRVPLVIK